ncbi:NADPH dehydrogenase [Gossypium australe]|uniref:NADPH dehydrogenase n=1 Tax=Gossypium australe TaxID=47621 RepID=A0A5B6WF50_9ROSI|nr:NADPH dehydrogenase [Gossypium australe]
MVIMDLKGITWVGHVYQKFEAMCLEAEEIMYQDTVKYVEDQVQTVGASVKRFYSDVMQDVMQDLLLPSSLEPVKAVAASDMAIEKNAGTFKKPQVGLKVAAVKDEGEQLIEDSEVTSDVIENAAHVPSSCQLHMVDNIFHSCPWSFMERESSYFLSREHNNRSMLVKANVENLPAAGAETVSEVACMGNEVGRLSSFSGNANANIEESCQQIPTTSTRVTVGEDDCDSIEESCNEIESASESVPEILDNDLQLFESIGIKMDGRCSSSVIGSAEPNGLATAGSCSNAGMISLIGCSLNSDSQEEKFPIKLILLPVQVFKNKLYGIIRVVNFAGQSNNWTMDSSGSAVGRKESGTVPPLDKTGVDESCIIVNEAELHCHPHRQGKHRPYQKKIRDAISSRMRSARKMEYKQLAKWYGDVGKCDEDSKGNSMSAQTREATRRSSTQDLLDSEWVLL